MRCSVQDYGFGILNSAIMCSETATWWELDEEDPNVRYPTCTRHKAEGLEYVEIVEEI